jgi:hypothetical protein
MAKHSSTIGKVAIASCLLSLTSGCASGGQDPEELGTAVIAVTQAPTTVQCLRVAAEGPRVVRRAFSVDPARPTRFYMSGLPTGLVNFSAQAFDVSCAALGGPDTMPGGVGNPDIIGDPSGVGVGNPDTIGNPDNIGNPNEVGVGNPDNIGNPDTIGNPNDLFIGSPDIVPSWISNLVQVVIQPGRMNAVTLPMLSNAQVTVGLDFPEDAGGICRPSLTSCAEDDECCSSQCQAGACCLDLGQSHCHSNRQCCSGVCDVDRGACCAPLRAACTSDSDCCTRACNEGVCVVPEPACAPAGATCASAEDCCEPHDCAEGRCQ